MRFGRKPQGKPGEWYYCVQHHKVEEGPECPARDRLGPYESRPDAEHALQTVAERNEKWDTDPRWNDRPEDEDS
ncbi:hypothetical protein [Peterkaempfera sp. SMS 1(5)a]|uniref:hypothetical protein n=1 Tax=Peterkaempfera podocarpi TaxID=3232308 RepID=UPI00366D4D5C